MGHLSRLDPLHALADVIRPDASRRVTLHENAFGRVEDAYVSPRAAPPSGHESSYQIVVPYYGLFAYCVGSKRWLMDSNSLLLISPGWDFRDEHPIADAGHGAVLVSPPRSILQEICHGSGGVDSAFRAATRTTTPAVGLLASFLRRNALFAHELEHDELLIRLIRESLVGTRAAPGRESRVVGRAKEILHSCSDRLSLSDIAGEVGVSAVYLTQEFTRSEGVPLYRYQLRLRLNRALAELAHCDDITGLALDLGFCSHSHFTSAFRSSFGLTPSEYRAATAPKTFPPLRSRRPARTLS